MYASKKMSTPSLYDDSYSCLIVEYVIFLLLALGLFCLHSTMMKCLFRT